MVVVAAEVAEADGHRAGAVAPARKDEDVVSRPADPSGQRFVSPIYSTAMPPELLPMKKAPYRSERYGAFVMQAGCRG